MQIRKSHWLMTAYILSLALLALAGYLIGDYTAEQTHKKQGAITNHNFTTDIGVIDLPRISMTLASGTGASGRIRIDMSLEVEKRDLSRVQDFQPVIMDKLVDYMRQLRMEDVRGPNAVPMLRKEIKSEVYNVTRPIPIVDVVFRQFVIM